MRGNKSKALDSAPRVIANGEIENEQRNSLNRHMMQLPMEERRRRWTEYYTRLGEIMKTDQKV
jgi:hypothetical protein